MRASANSGNPHSGRAISQATPSAFRHPKYESGRHGCPGRGGARDHAVDVGGYIACECAVMDRGHFQDRRRLRLELCGEVVKGQAAVACPDDLPRPDRFRAADDLVSLIGSRPGTWAGVAAPGGSAHHVSSVAFDVYRVGDLQREPGEPAEYLDQLR